MQILDVLRITYLLAGFLVAALATKAILKKTKLGSAVGQAMYAAAAVITFYFLSLCTEDYFLVSLCNSLTFVSIDIMLLLLLRYITIFTKYDSSRKNVNMWKAFGLITIVDGILLMLNPFKEFAISYEKYFLGDVVLYKYTEKTYFYLHLLFCYSIIIITVGILIYKVRLTPRMYRSRYLNTLFSFMFAVLINFLFLAGAENFDIDFSYIFYALVAIFMYTSTFLYKDRFMIANRNTVFQNIGIPILLFDYEQNLSDFNDQAQKIFPFLHLEEVMSLDSFLQESGIELESKFSNSVFTYSCREGEEDQIYRGDYVCFKEDAGRFSASMFTLHNVTREQKRIEKEQIANRTKSNFLVNVSHGIKRPLYNIIRETNELLIQQLDIENHRRLENIYDEGKSALSLVDELMDYCLLESGHYQVHYETVNVAEYVAYIQRIVNEYRSRAEIELEIDDYLPYQVVSNLDRLKQIADVLIQNAVDNCGGEKVRILVYYSEEGMSHGTLELEITDRGPGLSIEILEHLQKFLALPAEQVDNVAIHEGLELYMVCRMARFMGGDVEIDSAPEKGSFLHAFVHVELEAGTEYMKMKN